GNAFPLDEEITTEIKGRNLLSGLPENITVTSTEIREALIDTLQEVLDAIRSTLEKTPPELSADIIDQGITLTGGGALLRGIDKLIAQETGMHVTVANDPLDCVALGTGIVLENLDKLSSVFSSDEIKY
ncbi:MAG: rod shape-determining protein, partial [Oscillospiraceae bacterium]